MEVSLYPFTDYGDTDYQSVFDAFMENISVHLFAFPYGAVKGNVLEILVIFLSKNLNTLILIQLYRTQCSQSRIKCPQSGLFGFLLL